MGGGAGILHWESREPVTTDDPRSGRHDDRTAPAEDADPAEVDMLPELWGRALTSVPFAIGFACWWIALAMRALNVVWHRDTTAPTLLCLVAVTVLWAVDAGRRPSVFRRLPRAWDDPSDAIRVDWAGTRRRRYPPNRGFVHADGRLRRAVWGTVHGWDLLVAVAACIAMGFGDAELTYMAGIYTLACASVIGLPRLRRVVRDLELSEVVEVRVGFHDFRIRTTRSGADAELVFTTWKSDRDAMVVHLRAAFGPKVHVAVPNPPAPPGLADAFRRPPG